MKVVELKTSFDFVNGREYVHSTSILEYIWKHTSTLITKDEDVQVFIDARFHRLLKHDALFVVYDEYKDFSNRQDLTTECVVYGKNSKYYTYLFEDKDSEIKKVSKFQYTINNLKLNDKYSGSCEIDIKDAISYLSNIIEANKQIHETSLENTHKSKIINLYMKKVPVYCLDKSHPTVNLVIKNLGVRSHKGDLTTLNRFSFPELDIRPFDIAFLVEEGANE